MTKHRLAVLAIAVAFFASAGADAQGDEHAAHHPPAGAVAAGDPSAMGSAAAAPAPMAGGMAPGAPAAGMGDMMAKMMAPAGASSPAPCMGEGCGSRGGTTPLYPSLMALPSLTREQRAAIDELAARQMDEGMSRLAQGSESLNKATQADDTAAMQQAVGTMREGLDELEAGIGARRVLSEGKAPRNLALDWFKRDMNLASPIASQAPQAFAGVAALHLFTMALLVGFALAMVGMYFFKMRRAAALFGRLEGDAGSPPPGSAPPLAGSPAPPTPVSPPGGGSPPSTTPPPTTSMPEAPPGTSSTSSPAPPMTANWKGQLRIGDILTETPAVKTIRLVPRTGEKLIPFTFVPGQFLNVAFWIGGARMNRSYSISSSPTEREHVDLTVRREPRGAVSRHVVDILKVGDLIEAAGPVGHFTFTGTEADSVVLVAGGVGITPMMSIARYLTKRAWPGEIFLLYACRVPSDFIFQQELAALQRLNPKLHVVVAMSRAEGTNWDGHRGRLTKELFTQAVPNLTSRRFHVCGPAAMMESTREMLTELGVPPDQIKTELFGATKPSPSPAGTTAKRVLPATGPLVTFLKHNKSSKIREGQTVLELSEELAIGIENSCRIGTCGVCKVKLTSGEVEMAVEDSLEPGEKTQGIILACQARPTSDIAVEA